MFFLNFVIRWMPSMKSFSKRDCDMFFSVIGKMIPPGTSILAFLRHLRVYNVTLYSWATSCLVFGPWERASIAGSIFIFSEKTVSFSSINTIRVLLIFPISTLIFRIKASEFFHLNRELFSYFTRKNSPLDMLSPRQSHWMFLTSCIISTFYKGILLINVPNLLFN